MNNLIVKDRKKIEKYRKIVFKSKEECRRIFAREPFEKKIIMAFELQERAEYLKKFKIKKTRKTRQTKTKEI